MDFYNLEAAVYFTARHVEEFRSCRKETTPMGISDSYLAYLVTIIEPQAIYHPRLPAPLPSGIHGTQIPPTAGSAGSSASPDASVTPGLLLSSGSSEPGGNPRRYLVDVHA
jgi:hypothetical protein